MKFRMTAESTWNFYRADWSVLDFVLDATRFDLSIRHLENFDLMRYPTDLKCGNLDGF